MVAAVLVAAAMHAAWNAIAHAIDDRLVGFALISVAYLVVGATIVAVTGLPPADAWPFIAVSAVTHVAYNLFLMASYQLGDFSQTYPLARGSPRWSWRRSASCCYTAFSASESGSESVLYQPV